MKSLTAYNSKFWLGLVAVLLLSMLPLPADPISLPPRPVSPEITTLSFSAILLEAICIALLLRRFRRPRLFVTWVLGMHLITYPAFIGLLWLLDGMLRPSLAVAFGEGLVVVVEGSIIYLICRYVPTPKTDPVPSMNRCWLVSLAGNACSFIAFPILLTIYEAIFGRPF